MEKSWQERVDEYYQEHYKRLEEFLDEIVGQEICYLVDFGAAEYQEGVLLKKKGKYFSLLISHPKIPEPYTIGIPLEEITDIETRDGKVAINLHCGRM